tara:strand:- start:3664 stop:4005 length:342 start_codon:yes stop_codon:yes gene_type:complete
MTSRYETRRLFRNLDEKYVSLYEKRNVNYVSQYNTPSLIYPTVEQIGTLSTYTKVWKQGDKFWKYAAQYYNGRSDLWWVIAWFNQMPTEGNLEIGDIIVIPTPIEKILDYYGY